ncbi:MAG TPA: hypothetical protein VMB03_01755 [Bryobacteraceae bacterium]|nr:hypothetical protein [Bryobacteraceae bacterium]
MAAPAVDLAGRACAAERCVEAIEAIEQAVAFQPGDFRLFFRLGVCYSGCCRPHALVHPELSVPYLRQALRLVGSDAGHARAAVLDQLGNALLQRARTEGAESLRDAIETHLAAAEAFRSLGQIDDWARVQFNIGNSYCNLSETTGENHWRRAVEAYEKTLLVRTRSRDPERCAAALENLGTAWRQAGDARKSIQCLHRALRISVLLGSTPKCADLHNNLGNAFLSLPAMTARNALRALRHFDRALNLQAQDAFSRAYGITQYNCAQAHIRLARLSGAGDFQPALKCLHEASRAFHSCGEQRFDQLIRTQLERFG